MPLYEYQCPDCGYTDDAVRSINARHDGPICGACGEQPAMTLVISAVRGFVKFPAAAGQEYVSATTGRAITTERARRDDLARSGCRPYEGLAAESKEAARIRARDDTESEKKLHDNVAAAYAQLPPAKKAVLNNEVTRQQESDAVRSK